LQLIKNSKKTITMKKLFAILAVAGVMTACNNATEAVDAAKASADSLAKATAASEAATKTADSLSKVTNAVTDSLNKVAPKTDTSKAGGMLDKLKDGANKLKDGAVEKVKEGAENVKGAVVEKVKEAVKH
jgi:vacuolar-type H+-ATPase subunit E/Vma4